MKQKFSVKWKTSKQPRKQRKFRVNAPLHIKRKMLAAPLSKELKNKYGKKSLVVRKGDSVKIMKGAFKGKEGKILTTDIKKMVVSVEGIQRARRDGTKTNVLFRPSNLLITAIGTEDKKRIKIVKKEKTNVKGGK
ncbi:MAG: 50S ribosomal protein L24 [Candidatus Pacearchaeota archaeon]|nr:50S ribosomal protein L24 [Candidatus Pacearchaeota archaeon]